MRIWITLSPLVALAVLTAVASCVEDVEDTSGSPEERVRVAGDLATVSVCDALESGVSGVILALGPEAFPGGAGVTGARVGVTRTSCGGEPFTAYSGSYVADWGTQGGGEPKEEPAPEDILCVPLSPGCYDVVVQPMTKDGTPSDRCPAVGASGVVVLDGFPAELVLVGQCNRPASIGALDLLSLLDGPTKEPYQGDVVGIDFAVKRVSCNGEVPAPYMQVYSEVVSSLVFLDPFDDGGELRRFADVFVPLESGCYDVTAQPKARGGQASADCAAVTERSLVVLDGAPTDALFVHPCGTEKNAP